MHLKWPILYTEKEAGPLLKRIAVNIIVPVFHWGDIMSYFLSPAFEFSVWKLDSLFIYNLSLSIFCTSWSFLMIYLSCKMHIFVCFSFLCSKTLFFKLFCVHHCQIKLHTLSCVPGYISYTKNAAKSRWNISQIWWYYHKWSKQCTWCQWRC